MEALGERGVCPFEVSGERLGLCFQYELLFEETKERGYLSSPLLVCAPDSEDLLPDKREAGFELGEAVNGTAQLGMDVWDVSGEGAVDALSVALEV